MKLTSPLAVAMSLATTTTATAFCTISVVQVGSPTTYISFLAWNGTGVALDYSNPWLAASDLPAFTTLLSSTTDDCTAVQNCATYASTVPTSGPQKYITFDLKYLIKEDVWNCTALAANTGPYDADRLGENVPNPDIGHGYLYSLWG